MGGGACVRACVCVCVCANGCMNVRAFNAPSKADGTTDQSFIRQIGEAGDRTTIQWLLQ